MSSPTRREGTVGDGAVVEVAPVDPADPGVLAAHGRYADELADRFPAGFDPGGLTQESDRYRAPDGACVAVWHDGDLVGTVALAPLTNGPDDPVALPLREIKRMWVAPHARGLGLGRRLLEAIEEQARVLGTATLRLDTNEVLTTAITLYESAGYRRIARYNDNPYATHFLEKRLDAPVDGD